jgi:Spy/CpxP family protein refolding chaperone
MEDMRFQHQKSMIQKRAQLKEAQLEMRNMMRKTEIDESAVLEKQRRISNLKGDIAESRMKHRLEMRKVLTPEQREKMKTIRRDKDKFRKFHRDGERPRHRGKRGDCDGPGSGPAPGMGPR